MHEKIVEKLDDIEAEWEEPMGERLLKVLVVGAVTLVAGMIIEWAYDLTRDQFRSTDEIVPPELTE